MTPPYTHPLNSLETTTKNYEWNVMRTITALLNFTAECKMFELPVFFQSSEIVNKAVCEIS